jgi:Sec-independent protein translocase protein TatA
MLDQVKEYATAIFGTVIVVVVAALIAFGVYEAHKVKSLTEAAGKSTQQIQDLTSANKNLKNELDLAKKSGQINDQVVTDDVQAKAATAASQAIITAKTDAQIAVVKKKYEPAAGQPISASAAKAETNEISRIRVNSLWDTYCNNVSASTTGCAAVPAPASDPSA